MAAWAAGRRGNPAALNAPPALTPPSDMARHPAVLVEFFAGEGVLSKMVAAAGIEAIPEDIIHGGCDFSIASEVKAWQSKLRDLARDRRLLLHFAPPGTGAGARGSARPHNLGT